MWGFTLKGRDVVLGLLMEKELSGYDIKVCFEDYYYFLMEVLDYFTNITAIVEWGEIKKRRLSCKRETE